jgi:transposase-like protein
MCATTPFKWSHFEAEIILLCVRWYLRYSLSYRDLEEILLERGLRVDHTTIYRWYSAMPQSSINGVARTSKARRTPGVLMRRP